MQVINLIGLTYETMLIQNMRAAWDGWQAAIDERYSRQEAAARAVALWRASRLRPAFVGWQARMMDARVHLEKQRQAASLLMHSSLAKVLLCPLVRPMHLLTM